MLILIVDDQFREALVERFESEGATVVEAVNGKDAQEKLDAGPRPDVMITDLNMPVWDGNDLVEWVAKQRYLDSMRVCFITGAKQDISPAAHTRANFIFNKGTRLKTIANWVYEREDDEFCWS